MSKIVRFSTSTLKMLQQDENHIFYVYCLVDPRTQQPFYIGKGKGNRIFAHKQAAKSTFRKSGLFDDNETISHLKMNQINEIIKAGYDVLGYIVSHSLTESEAFASENVLINYIKLVQKIPLTNIVNGHGASAMLVEEIEERFGYSPMDVQEIATDELILAVKITDAFRLEKDESREYTFYHRDDANLKSRTLGNWVIGRDKIQRINYIIGVNTGADNAIVSAYEVSADKAEKYLQENGRTRYSFTALSKTQETMAKLDVHRRSIPKLRFGSGAATSYIN